MHIANPSAGSVSLLKPFYPSLDGLRAIAFLMVLFAHYNPFTAHAFLFDWGWVGIDFFFVLSGFLITGILYDSLHRPGYFRNYYARRALRIFPLYVTFWIIILLLTPILHLQWNRYIFATIFYIGNFFIPGAMAGLHASPQSISYPSLHHAGMTSQIYFCQFWSLCVDEQFYFVWPIVVWLVRKRVTLMWLCATVATLVLVGRCIFVFGLHGNLHSEILYSSTYSRADSLLIGAFLGLLFRGPQAESRFLRPIARWLALAAPVTLVALVYFLHPTIIETRLNPIVDSVGFTISALGGVGILLIAIDPTTRLHNFLNSRPLIHLGRISYGLYVFHFLPFGPLGYITPWLRAHHMRFVPAIAAFLFSWACAELSFRFIESPFLRLKDRFASSKHASDPVPVPPRRRRIPSFSHA